MKRRIRKRAAVITASHPRRRDAVGIGISASAGAVPQKPPSKERIAALFDGWNAALRTGDPEKVADRYASDAVLLPTVSTRIRDTHAEIVDYFEHFLANKPVGRRRSRRSSTSSTRTPPSTPACTSSRSPTRTPAPGAPSRPATTTSTSRHQRHRVRFPGAPRPRCRRAAAEVSVKGVPGR